MVTRFTLAAISGMASSRAQTVESAKLAAIGIAGSLTLPGSSCPAVTAAVSSRAKIAATEDGQA
jgi:hypothetical protein